LPNLLNAFAPWSPQLRADRSAKLVEEMNRLNRDAQAQKFDAIELVRRQQEIMQGHQTASQQADREIADRWEKTTRLVNMILPVTWLPMGVISAAEGRILPSILGLLGMTSIGTVSLWRAYRTTIGLYQGQPTNRNSRPTSAIAPPASVRKEGALMVEAHLPGLSEPVSVIALAGFRSLVRSPEAKMMLLTPVIMSFIFGSMLFRQRHDLPESLRPLVAIGGMGVVLLGVLQLMSNQFGFDRDGFRTFVMCAAPRREILLGKNLSFAPVALGMAAILLTIVQIVNPLRLDHFLAMLPQYISMFFLCCICTNLLSIYAPVHVAAGSLKPSNPKVSTVLLQLAMVFFLFPLTQGATLLPLGIEALLRFQGWGTSLPICLLLSLAECALIVVIYRFSLIWQGRLLQAREQKILEIVTNRAL
jgi:ABC-2 type transport system permease protein